LTTLAAQLVMVKVVVVRTVDVTGSLALPPLLPLAVTGLSVEVTAAVAGALLYRRDELLLVGREAKLDGPAVAVVQELLVVGAPLVATDGVLDVTADVCRPAESPIPPIGG
jgi:hypothetical protein